MHAYAGRIVHVDLGERRVSDEPLDPEVARRFLGARGVNAHLLWRELRPGTDPLSPDNPLIFGLGPLTGTHAPSSGRYTVTTRSPAGGFYAKTNAGGHWGLEAKLGGTDHLVLHGRAEGLVYLWLHDGQVEVRDASHLWGLDVRQTTRALLAELGDDRVQVACIGPAGERQVACAAIMSSFYKAAARCGVGAVMGSKRVKAIVVRGHRGVRVADPEDFDRAVHALRRDVAAQSATAALGAYGTAVGLPALIERKTFPSLNFQRGTVEGAEHLTGQALTGSPHFRRPYGCATCPVSCHRYTAIAEGPYAGTYSGGPEFETLGALGAGCGTGDLELVMKANELCNLYGLDTISAGSLIQWTMECFQRGVLTAADTGGLEVRWGSAEAILALLRQIAYREGFGETLAGGLAGAARQVGQGSERWAMVAKGLEQSRNENRFSLSYALAFAVNPRGPDHLATIPIAERSGSAEARAAIERITGDARYHSSYITDKRAEIVRWHEDTVAATDALGMCTFLSVVGYGLTFEHMARLFETATGLPVSPEEVREAGRRIVTLERCLNVREGATRADDRLPYRTLHDKLPDRPEVDPTPFPLKLERMLDEYYALHGWDPATARPTREVLERLDLADVAEELRRAGHLP